MKTEKEIEEEEEEEEKLPEEIEMRLPINKTKIKFNLIKNELRTNNLKVIVNKKGHISQFHDSMTHSWKVYTDSTKETSISVSRDLQNGTFHYFYDGTLTVNKTKFRLFPSRKLSPMPLNPYKTSKVLINGTLHLITEEPPPKEKYLRAEMRASGVETPKYIMSEIERVLASKMAAENSLPSNRRYTVELLMIIDYSIFYKWKQLTGEGSEEEKDVEAVKNIRYFYSHIIAGINDRYKSLNNSYLNITIKPVGFIIAQSQADVPFIENPSTKIGKYEINVYQALDLFEDWVEKATKSSNPIPRFDSIALFTDYQLNVLPQNYRVLGLANIGKACSYKGLSINYEFGQYSTTQTAAHELGHNLGAHHDGIGNNCNSSNQFLMASSPKNTPSELFYNSYTFSSCSKKYFSNFLKKLDKEKQNCLLNNLEDLDEVNGFLDTFPGQNFSVDEQCQLMFGQKSFYCAGGGDKDIFICKSLNCFDPDLNQCVTHINQRALDGTSCGSGKWCMRSTCLENSQAPLLNKTCLYGDYKGWFSYENKTISCDKIPSQACYLENYMKLCCSTCNKKKNLPLVKGCEFGDRGKDCDSYKPMYCYDSYNETSCCETCQRLTKDLQVPNCKYGDKTDWCEKIDSFACYSEDQWCCERCLQFKINFPGCEYGDKFGGCTLSHCGHQIYKDGCCLTCSNGSITSTTPFSRISTFPSSSPLLSSTTLFSSSTVIHGNVTIKHNSSTIFKSSSTSSISNFSTSTSPNINSISTTSRFLSSPISGKPYSPFPEECFDSAYWCPSIHPAHCYADHLKCCYTCRNFYKGMIPGCEFGDKASWCKIYVQGGVECMMPEVNSLCCETCLEYNIPKPECPFTDQDPICLTIGSWDCYSLKDTCCKSCIQYYNSSHKGCEYGDKVSWCGDYVRSPRECTKPEVADLCCKTCSRMSNQCQEKPCCLDYADWCKNMFPGFCYESSTLSTCCATCRANINLNDPSCLYGDKFSWCAPEFCALNKQECCKTCV